MKTQICGVWWMCGFGFGVQVFVFVVVAHPDSLVVEPTHVLGPLTKNRTPLANNLTELWALLNFLEPQVFTTSQPFDDAFDLSTMKIDKTKLDQAHALLRIIMLRRLKATVEQKLPPKIETRVECPLSSSQLWWYKALLVKYVSCFHARHKQIPLLL